MTQDWSVLVPKTKVETAVRALEQNNIWWCGSKAPVKTEDIFEYARRYKNVYLNVVENEFYFMPRETGKLVQYNEFVVRSKRNGIW